jgi:ribosomal protein S27E
MINRIIADVIESCLNKPQTFSFCYEEFICQECGKVFTSQKGCKIHIVKKHKKELKDD